MKVSTSFLALLIALNCGTPGYADPPTAQGPIFPGADQAAALSADWLAFNQQLTTLNLSPAERVRAVENWMQSHAPALTTQAQTDAAQATAAAANAVNQPTQALNGAIAGLPQVEERIVLFSGKISAAFATSQVSLVPASQRLAAVEAYLRANSDLLGRRDRFEASVMAQGVAQQPSTPALDPNSSSSGEVLLADISRAATGLMAQVLQLQLLPPAQLHAAVESLELQYEAFEDQRQQTETALKSTPVLPNQ